MLLGWIAAAAALALAGVYLFAACFGQFAEYDDQGYLMLAVGHLLDGRAPYSEIATPYGPIYFLERWLVHGVLRVPLTTDGVRWVTVVSSTLAAGAFGLAVWLALGRSRGALAACVATIALVVLPLAGPTHEPGHPQELYVLLVALACLCAARERGGFLVWGALAGALLLVKVNLGGFALVACGLGYGWGVERARRAVQLASAIVAILLPFALMRSQLDTAWVNELAWLSSLSLATSAFVLFARRAGDASDNERSDGRARADALGFALGLLALVALGVGFALLRGASLAALGRELVLAPLQLQQTFLVGPPARAGALVVQLAGALAGVLSCVGPARVRDAIERWVVPLARLALLALVVRSAWAPLGLFAYASGWAWVWIGSLERRESLAFARWRATLVALALLERLQVYPVSGSQLAVGQLLFAPLAVWGLVDLLRAPRVSSVNSLRPTVVLRAIAVPGALAALAVLAFQSRAAWEVRAAGEALALPGAQSTHAPRVEALTLRWLSRELAQGPTSWVSSIGSNSLYGWSGTRPPTRLLISHAWALLPLAEQERLVEALRSEVNPWVVEHPGIESAVVRDGPFFTFVEREMEPFVRFREYTLWQRCRLPAPPLHACAWEIARERMPVQLTTRATLWLECAGLAGVGAGASVRWIDATASLPLAATHADPAHATLRMSDGEGRELSPADLERLPESSPVWMSIVAETSAPADAVTALEVLDREGRRLRTLPLVERLRPRSSGR